MQNKSIVVELKARDRIELTYQADGSEEIQAVVCTECLNLIHQYQAEKKKVKDWDLPKGNSHSEILLRELILKARGEWQFPVEEEIICHCREVSTEKVDQAIIAGAHTMEQIRRETFASTSCGTCWPEIEKMIQYRLKK